MPSKKFRSLQIIEEIANNFKNKINQGVIGLVSDESYIAGWMLFVIVGVCHSLTAYFTTFVKQV